MFTSKIDFSKPDYHIVANSTKKRIQSAWTSQGISDIVTMHGYKVIDRLRNEAFGLDILVEDK